MIAINLDMLRSLQGDMTDTAFQRKPASVVLSFGESGKSLLLLDPIL